MSLFGATHGSGGKKAPSLKSVTLTMMKRPTVTLYLKKIKNIYIN